MARMLKGVAKRNVVNLFFFCKRKRKQYVFHGSINPFRFDSIVDQKDLWLASAHFPTPIHPQLPPNRKKEKRNLFPSFQLLFIIMTREEGRMMRKRRENTLESSISERLFSTMEKVFSAQTQRITCCTVIISSKPPGVFFSFFLSTPSLLWFMDHVCKRPGNTCLPVHPHPPPFYPTCTRFVVKNSMASIRIKKRGGNSPQTALHTSWIE